ncbi:MAG: FAD-binding protein, partial [Candidatus Dormibacteraeota bacterium]|nr:FAD-binding protein [Candidatus Dormibacteraeota bacterium]
MLDELQENWSGLHRYGAARVHEPQTPDEVRRLVAGARRVRGLGSRHSFNEVADSEGGELISLRKLPLDLVVDRERMRVTASAGASYGELAAELDRHGLALHNMASLPHVTLAGAVATGTHGSGDHNRGLAAAVRGIELVRPDGTLTEVAEGDPDWEGFPVSLGYLGLVTRLTLAVEPAFTVRQHVYRDIPWDVVLGHFDEIMAGAY